ncbi:flagellar biosynthesis protein [Scopulibacillus daqui]|uniref:Flagellar biosynthesis protein n=1 Tax=Scopulibacillus daqui TaxID=1469162 RepID=A0ABS2PWC2_9BACL|nr:EscU/YscU/HrcU family type III secretion system export apparatus switch protein [Scopulibacillus daqui]MBM7644341.1 flagellar biosynthesis protein [Scopulibacillus daqui]
MKKAVALAYQNQIDEAPRVIAKGSGETAEKIIDIAKKEHIPISEDPSMVAILSELDLNQSIPPELYQAVAEIFAFIYFVDKQEQS